MTYKVKVGTKLFSIVETIQKLSEPTLTDIATELDLPRSTTHNHLQTLRENDYVIENDGGQYHLSLKFLDHGVHAKRRMKITQFLPPAARRGY